MSEFIELFFIVLAAMVSVTILWPAIDDYYSVKRERERRKKMLEDIWENKRED